MGVDRQPLDTKLPYSDRRRRKTQRTVAETERAAPTVAGVLDTSHAPLFCRLLGETGEQLASTHPMV